jgi:hypothetical protein
VSPDPDRIPSLAIFPDENTGTEAMLNQLEFGHTPSGVAYRDLSIKDAIRSWAPPNTPHLNDPNAYADHIREETGLDPNRKIGDLNGEELEAVGNAIRSEEKWIPGTCVPPSCK